METGKVFPTGLQAMRFNRDRHEYDVLPVSELLCRRLVLVLGVRDILEENSRALSEAMRWCLTHDVQLVILAAAESADWLKMRERVSDRQPAYTVWAMPTPELADVLGLLRGVDNDRPCLRNGWQLIRHVPGKDDYVVDAQAIAHGDDPHDFTALG